MFTEVLEVQCCNAFQRKSRKISTHVKTIRHSGTISYSSLHYPYSNDVVNISATHIFVWEHGYARYFTLRKLKLAQ